MNRYDELQLEKIYQNAQVDIYYDSVKFILRDVIKELYFTNKYELAQLKLCHLDRAIKKCKEASFTREIRNTKQYFKMCILSAIKELELEQFYED